MSGKRSKRDWKKLVVRWTAPKGFLAIVIFSIIVILFQYLIVISSIASGLIDRNVFIWNIQLPGGGFSFNIVISPLFHLVPIGVAAVLISSWIYLTQQVAIQPLRSEPAKKKRRFKTSGKGTSRFLRRKSRRIKHVFSSFSRRLLNALHIRGLHQTLQRLFFARAALRSAVSLVILFAALILLIYLVAYPSSIHDSTVAFYNWNSAFLGFVTWIIGGATTIAQTLAPIGWVASAFDGALKSVAPAFRSFFTTLGSVATPLVELDATGKYVFCQNLAAWGTALTVLAYVHLVKPTRRRVYNILRG